MSTTATPDIASIVRQVIAELAAGSTATTPSNTSAASTASGSLTGAHGVFSSVDEAVRGAQEAFEHLEKLGVEGRKKAIAHIRRIAITD
ncbi:MAG: hypothetical protein ACKOBP_12535, partial [Planctomycetia bacterium]